MNSSLIFGRLAMTTTAPDQEGIDPKVVKTALILITGFLAVIFDTTIVSVALHGLARQLHSSVPTIQWVTTGYLLALGIAVPVSTWGLRRFGGKRLWIAALTVFLAGSIGSSLAWNAGSLIAWRVVQGAGGGIMFPLLTTLIMQAAGGKALGRTVTLVAMPALLGPILGPLIGGAILTHLSWRFMFWVNVPFCAAGLILAARFLPADKPAQGTPRPRLDLPGLALLAPGVAAMILGLSNAGSAAGFAHPGVIVPLVIGIALTAAFTAYALGLARRHGEPLVDVRVLSRRPVAAASSVLFFSGFSLYGAMLLLPLYYQEVRGASPLTAGIMLVPQGAGTLLSRGLAGRLTDKTGARPVAVAGFLIVAAATAPFALAGPRTSAWLLALWLVIRGFGLGAVTIPVMAVAFLGLDKQQIAHSSVVTRTVQQIGGSFGTAVLAVILSGAVTARHGDLATGFDIAFWWATGFSAVAVLLSLWLPGGSHRTWRFLPRSVHSAVLSLRGDLGRRGSARGGRRAIPAGRRGGVAALSRLWRDRGGERDGRAAPRPRPPLRPGDPGRDAAGRGWVRDRPPAAQGREPGPGHLPDR
jgi:EmrB/QacA subfamily drug resistance transporter